MNEMMEALVKSIAETKRDEIAAVFNDYKEYMDTTEIAYYINKAFREMVQSIKEKTEGKQTKKMYCPVNGWDCPYWKKDNTCSMKEEEGIHPKNGCDDYIVF